MKKLFAAVMASFVLVNTEVIAAPFMSETGGTYELITDYNQVNGGDILVFASHATLLDGGDKVVVMTTPTASYTGAYSYNVYSDYNSTTGMPTTITLSQVNTVDTPSEYALTIAETKVDKSFVYLQNKDGKYLTGEDDVNYISVSNSKEKNDLKNYNGETSVVPALLLNSKYLMCEDYATFGRDNGFFVRRTAFTNFNLASIYRKVHQLNIGAQGYSTFYYGTNDVKLPEGVSAYTYKYDEATRKLMPEKEYSGAIGDIIPHATAVIVKAAPGSYNLTVMNSQSESAPSVLRGNDSDMTTKQDGDSDNGKYYLLANGQEGLGFYYGATDGSAFVSAGHKTYLYLSDVQASKGFYFVLPRKEDAPTYIKSQYHATSTDANSQWYNLSGQRVVPAKAGIYIKDGKTVVVK